MTDRQDAAADRSPDHDVDATVEALLSCVTGRSFLAFAGQLRAPVAAARPGMALCLAADAVGAASPWLSSDETSDLQVLRRTAHAVLAGGVPAWWSAPFDGAVQRWACTSTPRPAQPGLALATDRPTSPRLTGEAWEGYAQRPTTWVVTSDEVVDAAGRRRGGVDEWDHHGLWDGPAAAAPVVRRWRPPDDVRVWEVDGPDDWVALVDRHPGRVTEQGGVNPDLFAASADLDGIHMTLRGLLTARRWTAGPDEPSDVPRPWSFEVPQTRWLRPVPWQPLDDGDPLASPAHLRGHGLSHDATGDPRFDEDDEVDPTSEQFLG